MNRSITLPATITVALGKESGERLTVDTKRLPNNVVEAIIVAGVKVIMTNVYNGGGAKEPHKDKVLKAQKKLDSWYRGEFNIVERGDSAMSALREAYIDDTRAKAEAAGSPLTVKEVEGSIRATVTSVFGEKEPATFGRFIDACARLIAREEHGKDATEEQIAKARDRFEAVYQALADEAAKKRTAAAAKVDVTSIALAAFKKPA